MTRKQRSGAMVAVLTVVFFTAGDAIPQNQQAATCGTPGQPPCPLQAWMRANIGAPLALNDFAALARGLDRAAKLAPVPTWSSWAQHARAGAKAARERDLVGARAACQACHDQFRPTYKASYRQRAIPR